MSPDRLPHATTQTRFPRVSGDEPVVAGLGVDRRQFSPRERG